VGKFLLTQETLAGRGAAVRVTQAQEEAGLLGKVITAGAALRSIFLILVFLVVAVLVAAQVLLVRRGRPQTHFLLRLGLAATEVAEAHGLMALLTRGAVEAALKALQEHSW
jgi:hypothetical protein